MGFMQFLFAPNKMCYVQKILCTLELSLILCKYFVHSSTSIKKVYILELRTTKVVIVRLLTSSFTKLGTFHSLEKFDKNTWSIVWCIKSIIVDFMSIAICVHA